MRPVVLAYSFTGNNRLLAEALAGRIGCPLVEVVPRGKRWPISIALDLMFRRFPKIHPVSLPEHDHLLVIAPLWDRWIAHPMRSALKALGPAIGPYSFISLSGGVRPGQVAFVDEQLEQLTGQPPRNHWALYVEKLVPEEIRGTPKVSAYRVSPEELESYPELGEIVNWVRARP
ncbi:hypothetical protein [Sinisalibacter lacisalsi]|uniref:Flavodoxin n=1 Tax=Sinisalibacter lacisalsi TaxID=1526570 RepID=A0ABQ1QSQ6_9RHOB|nr:hypothetical protein [Sinisalibacter lacisalsi]GGD44214.1 hypothetical protein GCM10011358_29980 [Sinisalibacter lacisalsi]